MTLRERLEAKEAELEKEVKAREDLYFQQELTQNQQRVSFNPTKIEIDNKKTGLDQLLMESLTATKDKANQFLTGYKMQISNLEDQLKRNELVYRQKLDQANRETERVSYQLARISAAALSED